MFEKLIDKIEKSSILKVEGIEYKVHSKVFYSTKNNPNDEYAKIKLDGNRCLVIIPNDETIYIGEVINNMNYIEIDEKTILYNNKKYNKISEDYQIVKRVEFGNSYEKECSFADYNENNGNTIISLAVLTDTGERADVFAKVIDINSINFIK